MITSSRLFRRNSRSLGTCGNHDTGTLSCTCLFCHSLPCLSNSISPKQICQLVQLNPTCFPMSSLPPLAERKQKSCFQPNVTCKHDRESSCKKCPSALDGTISRGKALLSLNRAASALLASQPCSALTSPGFHYSVTGACMFLTESLNSLSSCNYNFPFSPLLYTVLLLPFLVPLVFINCYTTRGCSFECFHVAK